MDKEKKMDEIIEFLIEKGIDVNSKTSGGWNVLHILCKNYQGEDLEKIVQLLMRKKIDVAAETKDGNWNALQLLCRYYKGDKLKNVSHLFLSQRELNKRRKSQ